MVHFVPSEIVSSWIAVEWFNTHFSGFQVFSIGNYKPLKRKIVKNFSERFHRFIVVPEVFRVLKLIRILKRLVLYNLPPLKWWPKFSRKSSDSVPVESVRGLGMESRYTSVRPHELSIPALQAIFLCGLINSQLWNRGQTFYRKFLTLFRWKNYEKQ